MKAKFQKGDSVKIIAGKHRGSVAVIEAYFPPKNHSLGIPGQYQVKLTHKMHGTNVTKVSEAELEGEGQQATSAPAAKPKKSTAKKSNPKSK
jgi:ribosomal protein L24